MMYRVNIGQDEYIGSADEVVEFLRRTEGAPASENAAEYMRSVAHRLHSAMDIDDIDVTSPEAFLDSLAARRVLRISVGPEPSTDRVSAEEALGDGPIAYGPGVDPSEF